MGPMVHLLDRSFDTCSYNRLWLFPIRDDYHAGFLFQSSYNEWATLTSRHSSPMLGQILSTLASLEKDINYLLY